MLVIPLGCVEILITTKSKRKPHTDAHFLTMLNHLGMHEVFVSEIIIEKKILNEWKSDRTPFTSLNKLDFFSHFLYLFLFYLYFHSHFIFDSFFRYKLISWIGVYYRESIMYLVRIALLTWHSEKPTICVHIGRSSYVRTSIFGGEFNLIDEDLTHRNLNEFFSEITSKRHFLFRRNENLPF